MRFNKIIILCIFLAISSCSSTFIENSRVGLVMSGRVAITSDIILPPGESLKILPGTHVNVKGPFMIIASGGGSIEIEGTVDQKIFIGSNEDETWNGIYVIGSGELIVKHAEIKGGPVVTKNGATMMIADSYLHSYFGSEPALIFADQSDFASLDRVKVSDYYEAHFYQTKTAITDSLFEKMIGDGIDFDNSPLGTYIKNSTIRNSSVFNVDAIDFGVLPYPKGIPSKGSVENCLIYNISDKGVSVGEGAEFVTIKNSFIHNVGIGIASKDGSNVFVENVSIVESTFGINSYEERSGMGGGAITGDKLLIVGNLVATQSTDLGTIDLSRSIIQTGDESIIDSHSNLLVSSPFEIFADYHDYGNMANPQEVTINLPDGISPGFSGQVGGELQANSTVDLNTKPIKALIYSTIFDSKIQQEKLLSRLTNTANYDFVVHAGRLFQDNYSETDWELLKDSLYSLRKISPYFTIFSSSEEESIITNPPFNLVKNLSVDKPWYTIRKNNSVIMFLSEKTFFLPTDSSKYLAQKLYIEEMSLSPDVVNSNFKVLCISSLTSENLQTLYDLQSAYKTDLIITNGSAYYDFYDYLGTKIVNVGNFGKHEGSQSITVMLIVEDKKATIEVQDINGKVLKTDSWELD